MGHPADVTENCLVGENPPQVWYQKCCECGSSNMRVKEKHRSERTEFFSKPVFLVPKLFS